MNLSELNDVMARIHERHSYAWTMTIIVHPSRESVMVDALEFTDPGVHARVITSDLVVPGKVYLIDDAEVEHIGFAPPPMPAVSDWRDIVIQDIGDRILAESVERRGLGFIPLCTS